MADFTLSYVGGPQGSPVTPESPVRSVTNEALFETIAGIGGNFAENLMKQQKEKATLALQAQNDQTVSSFVQQQLSLADSVEMGDLSSAEARMRMRANLTRAIADNPALTVDLGKAHTTLVKTTGLGQAVYEGTTEEQQQTRIENAAIDAGWVRPDQSSQDKAIAAAAYQDFQRSIDLMGFEQKKVSLQAAKTGLVTSGIQQQSARLALAEKQQKINSQAAIGNASNAYMVKLGNDLEAIRQAKERGDIDATQAAIMADNAYLAVDQVTRQIGAQAGSEYISNVTSPMKMMLENYKGYMTGNINLTDMETRNATNVAMQTSLLVAQPEAARLVATSKLFPNSDLVTITQANELVMNFVKGNQGLETKPADVLPDYQEGKQALNTYLGMMSQTMGKVNNKTAVDEDLTKQDINNNLTNILRSIDVYGPTTTNATDYNGVMDFLSKTEVGRYITTQGGLSDQGAAFKASQAIEFNYANEVLPLIKEEWDKAKTGGKAKITYQGRTEVPGIEGQQPVGELITPKFMGGGVAFIVNPGVKDSFTRAKAKELNEKVAPVLNRLVRVSAHLSGTTDYKGVYDNLYSSMFEEAKVDGGNTGE